MIKYIHNTVRNSISNKITYKKSYKLYKTIPNFLLKKNMYLSLYRIHIICNTNNYVFKYIQIKSNLIKIIRSKFIILLYDFCNKLFIKINFKSNNIKI